MSQDCISVLHVDDDASFSDVVKLHLERCDESISVISAQSAAAGLEQLEEQAIDCVVSDYEMPGMDGLEFLKAVRAESSALPFILYTGKGSEEIAEKAINAGVDAYHQKQVGTGQYTVLAQHIHTLVDKYSATQRLDYLEREQHVANGAQGTDRTSPDKPTETISMKVVREVAEEEDKDPVELTPLDQSINTDAIDALFSQEAEETTQGAESVTFTYLGYTITISDDGEVTLQEE